MPAQTPPHTYQKIQLTVKIKVEPALHTMVHPKGWIREDQSQLLWRCPQLLKCISCINRTKPLLASKTQDSSIYEQPLGHTSLAYKLGIGSLPNILVQKWQPEGLLLVIGAFAKRGNSVAEANKSKFLHLDGRWWYSYFPKARLKLVKY